MNSEDILNNLRRMFYRCQSDIIWRISAFKEQNSVYFFRCSTAFKVWVYSQPYSWWKMLLFLPRLWRGQEWDVEVSTRKGRAIRRSSSCRAYISPCCWLRGCVCLQPPSRWRKGDSWKGKLEVNKSSGQVLPGPGSFAPTYKDELCGPGTAFGEGGGPQNCRTLSDQGKILESTCFYALLLLMPRKNVSSLLSQNENKIPGPLDERVEAFMDAIIFTDYYYLAYCLL